MRCVHVFSVAPVERLRELLMSSDGEESDWLPHPGQMLWPDISDPPCWVDGWSDLRDVIEASLGSDVRLVRADVSSRVVDADVPRRFALAVLDLGPGLAFDDSAEVPWTHERLLSPQSPGMSQFWS